MIKLLCFYKDNSDQWVCPEDMVSYWPAKSRHGFNTNTWIQDIKTWPGSSRYFRVSKLDTPALTGQILLLSSHLSSFENFEGLACIPLDIWSMVKVKQLQLLMVFVHEGFGDSDFHRLPSILYGILDRFEIDHPDAVTVVLGTKFPHIEPDSKNRVRWVYYPWYAGIAQQQAQTKLPTGRPLIPKTWGKPLDFLFMNGSTGFYKDLMLKLLEYHGIANRGIHTRPRVQTQLQQWHSDWHKYVAHHTDFAAWLDHNHTVLADQYLDCKHAITGIGQRWHGAKILYDRCAWELVNENMQSSSGVFLSINTFRSLLMGMPFLLSGCRGSLALLRDLGFKTFDIVIDESYDLIENPIDRMVSVAQQIKFITQLSTTARQEMWTKLQPVLQHNQDLAWTQQHLKSFHDTLEYSDDTRSDPQKTFATA